MAGASQGGVSALMETGRGLEPPRSGYFTKYQYSG
jgi:hypothetical protein